ncbi:MAG TPA: toll/interleukin-1 receptor domain-containing protein [Thermoanaerobaculia bacterium]
MANLLYKAFICYSRHDVDLAVAIQRALQRYSKPWYKVRALRVFRDVSSLPLESNLWSSIERALANSEYLVLLASPSAHNSLWVQKELEWWLGNRSVDSMLIVVLSGDTPWNAPSAEPKWAENTALPGLLQNCLIEEPNFGDMRWIEKIEQASLANLKFRDEISSLAATLHGVPKEDLESEEARQGRRQKQLMLTIACILLITTTLALFFAHSSNSEKERALQQQEIALREARTSDRVVKILLSIFETSDPDGEPSDVRRTEIKAKDLLDRGAKVVHKDLKEEPEILGRALEVLAAIYNKIGDYDSARKLARDAHSLALESYGAQSLQSASCKVTLAVVEKSIGNFEEAERLLIAALPIAESSRENGSSDLRIEILDELGELLLISGRLGEAERYLVRAKDGWQAMKKESSREYAITLQNLARVYEFSGKYDQAEELYHRALVIVRSTGGAESLTASALLNNLAVLNGTKGDFLAAAELSEQSAVITQKHLGREHPSVLKVFGNQGLFLLQAKAYDRARERLLSVLELRRSILGNRHLDTANSLYGLCLLEKETANLQRAELYCKESMNIVRLEVGSDSMVAAFTLTLLAQVHNEMRSFDSSRIEAEAAVRILNRPDSPKPDPMRLLRAEEALAISIAGSGNLSKGGQVIGEVFRKLNEQFGNDSVESKAFRKKVEGLLKGRSSGVLPEAATTKNLPAAADG